MPSSREFLVLAVRGPAGQGRSAMVPVLIREGRGGEKRQMQRIRTDRLPNIRAASRRMPTAAPAEILPFDKKSTCASLSLKRKAMGGASLCPTAR